MRRFPVHLVAMMVLGAPALVHAASLEQAKALVDRATIEYQVGNFNQALALYAKAYEAYPKPELLFDIGQCHRMRKDYERAIFFYQGYLRAKPDAPNRPLVEKLLDESSTALVARSKAEAAKVAAEQHAAAPSAPLAPEPSPPTGSPSPARGGAVEPARTTSGRPVFRTSGLATAGVGVVLVGTAAYLGLHALSLSNELSTLSSQHGMWSSRYESDYESGKSAARAATLLYVVGGVALAMGGLLTYLGWPRAPKDARPVATLAATLGGAAFVFASRSESLTDRCPRRRSRRPERSRRTRPLPCRMQRRRCPACMCCRSSTRSHKTRRRKRTPRPAFLARRARRPAAARARAGRRATVSGRLAVDTRRAVLATRRGRRCRAGRRTRRAAAGARPFVHTHAPPVQTRPTPHSGPEPHWHAPFAQLSARVESQGVQPLPSMPQLDSDGAVHVPPEQHPVEQEVASHTQLPAAEHSCPVAQAGSDPQLQVPDAEQLSALVVSHAEHASPVVPQVATEGVSHIAPTQHPPGQFDAVHPVQMPLVHVCGLGHASHVESAPAAGRRRRSRLAEVVGVAAALGARGHVADADALRAKLPHGACGLTPAHASARRGATVGGHSACTARLAPGAARGRRRRSADATRAASARARGRVANANASDARLPCGARGSGSRTSSSP